MRHDFVKKWTYVVYASHNLYYIVLIKVQFRSFPGFYTRDIPKITGTGAECRFLRTFLPSRAPLYAFWPAQWADFLPIVAPEQLYFAGKMPFARLVVTSFLDY